MKKLLFLSFLTFGLIYSSAQENFDVSTLRIGAYTINMKKKDIEKVSKTQVVSFTAKDENYKNVAVKYLGETIDMIIAQSSDNQGMYDGGYEITSLSTKSKKFATKSGMKVGSTRAQLLETYKNYPNFCISFLWNEKTHKQSTSDSIFLLTDIDAGTFLSFQMLNDVVTIVSVYKSQGD